MRNSVRRSFSFHGVDLPIPFHSQPRQVMFSPFSTSSYFDSVFGQSEPNDIAREIIRINRLYVISETALWFQQFNMIHLSENWGEIFRIPIDEIFLLEDYLALIENPEERSRISAGRESLISQEPGFEWRDSFTLRGQTVQTVAVVADGCIFGMDRIVGREENLD